MVTATEKSKIKNYISGNSSIHLYDFINNDKLNSKIKDFDFGIVRLSKIIFVALSLQRSFITLQMAYQLFIWVEEAKTIIDKYEFGWTFEIF